MRKLFTHKDNGSWKLTRRTLLLLKSGDRIRLYLFIGGQFVTSLLDSLGILLMGVLASIGLSVSTSDPIPSSLYPLLNFLKIGHLNSIQLLGLSGVAVMILLLIRTILSLLISLKTYQFLAKKVGEVSQAYLRKLLSAPFWWVRTQDSNSLSFALNQGVQYSVIGVLGQFIILCSEICFLVLLFFVLLFVNISMAAVATFFFVGFGAVIYMQTGRLITSLAENSTQAVVEGNQEIQNSIKLFREIRITSKQNSFYENFKNSRYASGMLFSRLNWLQMIPKYSVEMAVVFGAFFLAITATVTNGYMSAVADIAIFLAATSRIAPSALRLQQSLTTLRSFAGQASSSFSFYSELSSMDSGSPLQLENQTMPISKNHFMEIPEVKFSKVSYKFKDSDTPQLRDISFSINPGETVALVGSSGSGKSTLCDILLGLLTPTVGTTSIGQWPASQFVQMHPGFVSFLPQETFIFPGTIYENVTLENYVNSGQDEVVLQALDKAQLSDFLDTLPNGLQQLIGEAGLPLSGGQKQRIGLARAFYSSPSILILDEPTSSLDSETESSLLKVLQSMKNDCSMLIIAHRLSTLRLVDRVIYMEDGTLVAVGTVEEVKMKVPQFALHAGLQGF